MDVAAHIFPRGISALGSAVATDNLASFFLHDRLVCCQQRYAASLRQRSVWDAENEFGNLCLHDDVDRAQLSGRVLRGFCSLREPEVQSAKVPGISGCATMFCRSGALPGNVGSGSCVGPDGFKGLIKKGDNYS